jgi:alcohol dehydrogenase
MVFSPPKECTGMKSFDFHVATHVHFGVGSVQKVKDVAKTLGKKALLVAARDSMRQSGILGRVEGLLRDGGVQVVTVDDVDPNPTAAAINRQTKIFHAERCDFTVGLGGGSSMDSAKAVAFLAANGEDIKEFLAGGKNPGLAGVKDAYPIMCITTTAGTGSETTPWWVITNSERHEKPGTGNDSTMARIAIVDPELMVSVPPAVTRSTGIDVLFHAMEAFLANTATPFTDILCREAMCITVKWLGKAIENGKDLEARSQMAFANTIAGIAIGEGKSSTVAIHSLGHSIGGQTNAPHGLTMAAVGPAYLRRTWAADLARYAEVARILGADPSLPVDRLAQSSADALVAVLKKFGCHVTMSQLGVKESMIEAMTDSAFFSMKGCLDCSLVELSRSDIVALYKESF